LIGNNIELDDVLLWGQKYIIGA